MSEITLNGKRYELQLKFRSLLALEKQYNKSFSEIFNNELQDGSLNSLITIVWSCLLNNDSKLTINKVSGLLDEAIENGELTLDGLNEALQEAVENSAMVSSAAQQGDNDNEEGGEEEAKNQPAGEVGTN